MRLLTDERGDYLEVPSFRGTPFYIDAEDQDILGDRNWTTRRVCQMLYVGYTGPGPKYRAVLLHRLVMAPPPKVRVDHADGNGLNNRRYNLRLATNRQNTANKLHLIRKSPTGFRGVYPYNNSGKFCVMMTFRPEPNRLMGVFDTAEEAARYRDQIAYERYGEFAVLNFPMISSVDK